MMCPDCKQSMLILEFKEIELDFCPQCKGCWLDEGELEQMVHGREAAFRLVDWTGGVAGARRCPRCTEKLHVVRLPDGPEVDVCPAACGIWFDQGELRAALSAHRGDSPTTSEIIQTLTEMFGTWNQPTKE